MQDTIDKKIDTCFRSIRNLLYFITVMGSGAASTFGFSDVLTAILGGLAFKLVVIVELLAIAGAILHIFLKFARIENLNLEERQ